MKEKNKILVESAVGAVILIALLFFVGFFLTNLVTETIQNGVIKHEKAHNQIDKYIGNCSQVFYDLSSDGLSGNAYALNCTNSDRWILHSMNEIVGYNLDETNNVLYLLFIMGTILLIILIIVIAMNIGVTQKLIITLYDIGEQNEYRDTEYGSDSGTIIQP